MLIIIIIIIINFKDQPNPSHQFGGQNKREHWMLCIMTALHLGGLVDRSVKHVSI